MAWNFINDSLRTDVYLRYSSETIACSAIYLTARKMDVPLPRNPHWFLVLDVKEEDIHDWCYRISHMYNRKEKVSLDILEKYIHIAKHDIGIGA